MTTWEIAFELDNPIYQAASTMDLTQNGAVFKDSDGRVIAIYKNYSRVRAVPKYSAPNEN